MRNFAAIMQQHKTAIFPGTFDPFTVGHANILSRALPMFDRIIVGVGKNAGKHPLLSPEERVARIRQLYADEPRVSVESYDNLTVDFARQMGAQYILRGLRSVRDFEYERDVAAMNLRLGGLETIMLFCDAQYASISSSVVRELIAYGHDVSEFIPSTPHNQR